MCKGPQATTPAVSAPGTASSSSSSPPSASQAEETLSPRELKIVKLNERVEKIRSKIVSDAKKNGTESDLPLWVTQVDQKMTPMVAGYPVYQKRSAALVYTYCAFFAVLILYSLSQQSPLVSLLCFITMYIGYDIYSGILHVVFDHPPNISLPFIGQPCLEFQWHHAIPDDLVRKDFVDVVGDLNVVIGLVSLINCILLDIRSASSSTLLLGGLKFVMAYFGQFSHRSAHSVGSKLPWIGKTLQKYGFMISVKDHMAHHQEPYDKDFCLIGICNPLIDLMRQVTTNPSAWLGLFLVWSIFDVCLYTKLVDAIAATYL